jgi:hypothetical protein
MQNTYAGWCYRHGGVNMMDYKRVNIDAIAMADAMGWEFYPDFVAVEMALYSGIYGPALYFKSLTTGEKSTNPFGTHEDMVARKQEWNDMLPIFVAGS